MIVGPIAIAKEFTFEAAHRLEHLPEGHKCKRLHGHSYRVEIELAGVPLGVGPQRGFLIDYADIAAIWAPLHVALDHQYLNEVPDLETPTTEYLVWWILQRLEHAFRAHRNIHELTVTVSEAVSTWARGKIKINQQS